MKKLMFLLMSFSLMAIAERPGPRPGFPGGPGGGPAFGGGHGIQLEIKTQRLAIQTKRLLQKARANFGNQPACSIRGPLRRQAVQKMVILAQSAQRLKQVAQLPRGPHKRAKLNRVHNRVKQNLRNVTQSLRQLPGFTRPNSPAGKLRPLLQRVRQTVRDIGAKIR